MGRGSGSGSGGRKRKWVRGLRDARSTRQQPCQIPSVQEGRSDRSQGGWRNEGGGEILSGGCPKCQALSTGEMHPVAAAGPRMQARSPPLTTAAGGRGRWGITVSCGTSNILTAAVHSASSFARGGPPWGRMACNQKVRSNDLARAAWRQSHSSSRQFLCSGPLGCKMRSWDDGCKRMDVPDT